MINNHTAKGIARAAAEQLVHREYLDQLNTPTENYQTNRRIGAKLHQLYRMEVAKRGLCAFDNKRFILENGIDTLAYGHKAITANVQDNEGNPHNRDQVLSNMEARSRGIIGRNRTNFIAPGQDPRILDPNHQIFVDDDDDLANARTQRHQSIRKRTAAQAQLHQPGGPPSAAAAAANTSLHPLLTFLDLHVIENDE